MSHDLEKRALLEGRNKMNPLKVFLAALLFSALAAAEIPDLCNTGETSRTASGCTGILVTPNPAGGGPNRDGNWGIAYPYPSTLSPTLGPCDLSFIPGWVDSTPSNYLPDSASSASEWIAPYDGEGDKTAGSYVYRTEFHVPAVLAGGSVPTGLTIDGRLVSDNATYGFFLATPANGGACAFVRGLPVPINPARSGHSDFEQWWDFSFTSPIPITPDSELFLYVVVYNYPAPVPPNPTAFRVEFSGTSAFY